VLICKVVSVRVILFLFPWSNPWDSYQNVVYLRERLGIALLLVDAILRTLHRLVRGFDGPLSFRLVPHLGVRRVPGGTYNGWFAPGGPPSGSTAARPAPLLCVGVFAALYRGPLEFAGVITIPADCQRRFLSSPSSRFFSLVAVLFSMTAADLGLGTTTGHDGFAPLVVLFSQIAYTKCEHRPFSFGTGI